MSLDEKALIELLRRVATTIGEALIAGEIVDAAVPAFAELQDEITAAIGGQA